MYGLNEMQGMVNHINSDTAFASAFFARLPHNDDARIINRVINNRDAEEFYNYDSDVSETFISAYLTTEGHLF